MSASGPHRAGFSLHPVVLWSQTAEVISLSVQLVEPKNHQLQAADTHIQFRAAGRGAHGLADYGFRLDLYSHLHQDPEGTYCQVFDNRLEIYLKKAKSAWWPRLTAQAQKPVWLKVDFDRWKCEGDGIEDSEDEHRDVMNDYPGMYDKLQKEEMGYRKDIKKVYLICYNLFQFIGFLYVLCVMTVRYSKYDVESMVSTYEHVGSAMKFLQLMQFLEIMHPLFGYTKGGVLQPFFQITGRAIILFAMIETEPRMQVKPVVFYLFIIWSSIEIVRYPYYITQLYKRDIYLLTWLRYSLWIPLYPLGIICEGIIVLRNIPYFEETGRFTISMPNKWNFAFHMPSVMRLYLLLLFLPGLYVMLRHMYKARVLKLGLYRKVVIRKSN
ncbi:3-hydroxyacyl-CoA dehydratase 2 isoform X2 [Arctopsyche grandis]|uniref:3-hydroxyacyl-CoA dehydratase 2 isoform X2 n=1 Tax=Arctopsyche grandis TaxID=121162 RepID=UPI00406D695C